MSGAQTPMDPWLHASSLAQRLREPGTELLVVLGAESWCGKCQRLRPDFDLLAQSLPAHVLPLWLDLEDHADFLNGFVPDDLPLLLRWREGQCVQVAVLESIDSAPASGASPVGMRQQPITADLPDLWSVLSARNWAA